MKKDIAARLGLWSSICIAVFGGGYLFTLLSCISTERSTFPPAPIVQLIAGIITFFMVPCLLIQFTVIRFVNDEDNQILGSPRISFITLFAAMVSINRFVQLTVIQQSASGIASQDLTRFLPYSTGSIMFSLEMLGWGFFSSLAALCVAPYFLLHD